MLFSVRMLFREWIEELRGSWFRGLAVIHSTSITSALESLLKILGEAYRGGVTCIMPSEIRGAVGRGDYCRRVLSPSAIEKLLGTENDAVVIAAPKLLRPNLVAAAAETVKGGGVLAIAVPPLRLWQPGGEMSLGYYKRYLVSSLYRARSVFWASMDEDVVYAMRLPEGKAERAASPASYKPSSPMPRRLVEACETLEQAKALDKIIAHLRSKGRSVLALGDRGRGKSGLLALATAYAIKTHMVGFTSVTAPSIYNVQSFFRVLLKALSMLNVKNWAIQRGDIILGVAGPWFHVRYHTPDRAEPGSLLVVDEAAALGPLRLRSLLARAPRVLAATTIHGYEGSGRVLAKRVEELFKQPLLTIELKEPVRYAVNDPLEEWVYTVFMLRTPEYGVDSSVSLKDVEFVEVDRERLVDNIELLEKLYSILVNAHYRNEPDDLALMLDALHHRVYALLYKGMPIAVVQAAFESMELPENARIIPDILLQYTPKAASLKGVRVVRIAVHPLLQRRGFGSLLLKRVEDQAARLGLDWVGAVFGQPEVIGFWAKNSYLPVYVSPLPNKMTGEHNIVVLKPISSKGRDVLGEVVRGARKRLLLSAHNLYRGIPAETLYVLLSVHVGRQEPLARLDEMQLYRLEMFKKGVLDFESILDIVWLLLVNRILERGRLDLDFKLAIPLIMRVLQGKTLADIEAATRRPKGELVELLRGAVQELIARGGEGAATNCLG